MSENIPKGVARINCCNHWMGTPHSGRKSLILAPQDIPDISGYQWGFGCQCVKHIK